ncbi:DUF3800 domain-containing protein [Burkholderia aenigmatica]|uniref:DUF3800 domain-containing protein n=1 Tax=Burkholderia aenigmatica TaxID=2015348 RepID=UPI0015C60D19|nr:DUF3800 domain-containing protein [Burkholderia aenigmatica]
MIFVDESIQHDIGYICVGFAYCEEEPDADINDAIVRAGLTPGVDEYKSGYRMNGSLSRHELRDSVYRIVLERCKIGIYVASIDERPTLLTSVTEVVEQIIHRNKLTRPQSVFVDEGILGGDQLREGFQVEVDCDSKLVPGIQLADFVAYHCSYMLKCKLSGGSKKILLEDSPHPLAGEKVDLDWLVRTDFRRNFFVEQRNIEEITGDDWSFKLAGYGSFFSHRLSPQVREAAEETFDSMYFGCVW